MASSVSALATAEASPGAGAQESKTEDPTAEDSKMADEDDAKGSDSDEDEGAGGGGIAGSRNAVQSHYAGSVPEMGQALAAFGLTAGAIGFVRSEGGISRVPRVSSLESNAEEWCRTCGAVSPLSPCGKRWH